jgi:hypothetical protein
MGLTKLSINRPLTMLMTILTSVGSSGGGNIFSASGGGSSTADITVKLTGKTERERSTADIVEALRPVVKAVPEANIAVTLASSFGGGAVPFRFKWPAQIPTP